MAKPSTKELHVLPEFGTLGIAIRMVFLAIVIALIITIGRNEKFDEQAWQDLNLLVAFALALSLASALVLSLLSPWLKRASVATGSTLVVLVLLAVAVVGTDAMIFALHDLGFVAERWPPWRENLILRTLLVTGMISALGLRYLVVQRRAEIEMQHQQEARMQALQSRIRPHFVFNALNIIASLVRTDPNKAEKAIEDMADLFRMMLSEDEQLVPVKNEVDVTKQYLALEALRLDARLNVEWDVGTFPRKAVMPILTLQPLLENAIRHGIEELPAGGTVGVRLWEEANSIRIRVTNPVPAVRRKERITTSHVQSLDNIRRRFHSHYGDAATLTGVEHDGEFVATVALPIRGDKP
jgi:two-component system sensor histidine kinase AlgZ